MIDRTDPFNPVVKEKKIFEQKTIDQYVAAGLNKGIDVSHPIRHRKLIVGISRSCGVYFCDKAIGVRLLSSASGCDGVHEFGFGAYSNSQIGCQLSQDTYEITSGING